MTDNLSEDARNASELQRAVTNVMARHAASRPPNTIKQYKSKQGDFRAWCSSKKFLDGSLVYESKLVDYLDNFVIPRGNKRKKAADGGPVRLGFEAVDAYIKAIVDLYQSQKSIGMNQHPHPRGKALKSLVDMLRRGENKRKLEAYADRGLGTVLDGYNLADMMSLNVFWLNQPTGTALRNRVDFLVGHALLARGESRRFIQFPDMLSLSLPDEGPQVCTPLVVIMRKGKTNQAGRVEYGAAMRCKEVQVCPLNALAMYLFWRWHIDLEPFPVFTDRKRWYDIRLLKGADATRDISYNAQLEGVKTAFTACGIDSSVWTHANRGSGAKLAELQGADENQIRRAGRWNSERMEGCYLTTLPRKAMRALAGFPTKGGGYWLARATITPELELQRQVFRGLEEAESALHDSGSREIAASGFTGLLHDLRIVFLQDSVLLRKAFPNHRIWSDALFGSERYKTFEMALLDSLVSTNQPQDQRLELAIPLVASALESGFNALNGKIDALSSELRQLKNDSMWSSKKKLVLSIVDDEDVTGDINVTQTSETVRAEQSTPRSALKPTCTLRLSRSLQTIVELWVEYTHGLGGQMSVREAERQYSSKWRSDPTENRFYSRRKIFYDAIALYAAKRRVSEATAAEELEVKRKQVKQSLNKFGKQIRQFVHNLKGDDE